MITSKDHVINFGTKFPGMTVGQVMNEQRGPDYLLWCHENLEWFELSSDLHDEIVCEPDPLGHLYREE